MAAMNHDQAGDESSRPTGVGCEAAPVRAPQDVIGKRDADLLERADAARLADVTRRKIAPRPHHGSRARAE